TPSLSILGRGPNPSQRVEKLDTLRGTEPLCLVQRGSPAFFGKAGKILCPSVPPLSPFSRRCAKNPQKNPAPAQRAGAGPSASKVLPKTRVVPGPQPSALHPAVPVHRLGVAAHPHDQEAAVRRAVHHHRADPDL